jgi:hypothetical protein
MFFRIMAFVIQKVAFVPRMILSVTAVEDSLKKAISGLRG